MVERNCSGFGFLHEVDPAPGAGPLQFMGIQLNTQIFWKKIDF
jgi:hypothetical protein